MIEKIAEAVFGIGPVWYKILSSLLGITLLTWLISTPLATRDVTLYKMFLGAKPVIEFKMDPLKVLTIKNEGPFDLKDFKIYITKYVFDETVFLKKEWKIKNFNKVGGPIENIPLLKAKSGIEKIDLKNNRFISFFDNPGKESNEPILTYYCLRVVFTKAMTKEHYVHYQVTSSVKNFPMLVENIELTAIGGNVEWINFFTDIGRVIKEHQKNIFVAEDQQLIEV